jgi:hypothetical protein
MVMMQLELAGSRAARKWTARRPTRLHPRCRASPAHIASRLAAARAARGCAVHSCAMSSPVHGAISVTTPGHQYDIVIGRGLLSDATVWQDLPQASHAVIVTNPTVGALYTQPAAGAGAATGAVSVLALPDGEAYKTWESLNLVFDHLLGRAATARPCCSRWAAAWSAT